MSLKTTALHSEHLRLDGRMVEFAGFEMPISFDRYSGGMRAEHLEVRQNSGIFDVSHMGEFWIRGDRATDFLSRATTRNFEKVKPGRAVYSLLLRPDGGILDDIIVYYFEPGLYWAVVNASNIDKDFKHLNALASEYSVEVENVSDDWALIALQGPKASEQIKSLSSKASELKYYSFLHAENENIIARTGYTGEDGFEIFCHTDKASSIWKNFLDQGVKPIGLGARDTLRMEVGFPLYGQELREDLRPQETFSAFAVRNSGEFIGKTEKAPRFKPTAFLAPNPKPMRAHEKLFYKGEEVGELTSGSSSPSLKRGMGLGLLEVSKLETKIEDGMSFELESSGRRREVFSTSLPFVETARAKKSK